MKVRKDTKRKKIGIAVFCIVLVGGLVWFFARDKSADIVGSGAAAGNTGTASQTAIPAQALLASSYYVSQTFNNCGPAALTMDLSFYGVSSTQQQIADDVRPDNNLTGTDDEKSTSPEALAAEAETFGLTAYYRPNGTIDLLKQFIAAGIPVVTRALLNTTEDYAHYRVMKGYDDTTGILTEEDGFTGPNVQISYSDFLTLWKQFNYEYIVLATPSQQNTVESILGKENDPSVAWADAVSTAQQALGQNPNDTAAEFDLSVALYHTGDYQQSVAAYEQVAPSLSERALWYQIEPIESYYEIGDYSEVFSLSNGILNDGNPAFPELYLLQGESYLKQGNTAAAKTAFEQALFYNKNLASAQQALASLGGSGS